MSKTRKKSFHVVYEGYTERYFLEHLAAHSDVRLNPQFCSGGSANQIVITGIKHSSLGIPVLVFFDEDFESKSQQTISDETLEGLEKAWKLDKDALKGYPYRQLQKLNTNGENPVLVVSYPQSIEGFLLRLLGIPIKNLEGKPTKDLKNSLESILSGISKNDEDNEEIKEYDRKIAKYRGRIAQKKKGEPNYQQHCKFLEEKIKDCERGKNKVVFMRFLSEKLPLPAITAKRGDIPELDILLNAFGL